MSTNSDRNRNRLEVYNTLMLAIATLAVAWCSYQGNLWSGIQTFRLAESNKYGRLAQQKMIQSGQNKTMEEVVIIDFINAAYDKDKNKVDYILRGLRPELANILSNWLQLHPFETDSAPYHPMVMPEYEALMEKRVDESKKMGDKGEEMFKAAQEANLNSDRYGLLAVMFSMVMFLGAITTKLVRTQPRFVLVLVGAVICIGALIVVFFSMSVAHKG